MVKSYGGTHSVCHEVKHLMFKYVIWHPHRPVLLEIENHESYRSVLGSRLNFPHFFSLPYNPHSTRRHEVCLFIRGGGVCGKYANRQNEAFGHEFPTKMVVIPTHSLYSTQV